MTRRKPRWSSLLCLVPVLGLLELALHQYFATRAPGFAAYDALAPELKKLKQQGRPVVVAPRWAEPLLRQAAPEVFPISELARPDDSGFASFLEVSLLGHSAAELSNMPSEQQQRFGAFTLSVHRNPGFQPTLFDFASAVDSAEVQIFTETAGQRRQCPLVSRPLPSTGGLHGPVARLARHYECAGGRAVGVTLIEDQDFRPRRCILVDPALSGDVVLHVSGVPASPRLLGFAGFSYFLGRDFRGPSVELRVQEGGTELGRHAADPSEGWRRFELARKAPAGAIEVRVVRVQPEPGDFCFLLEAR